MMSAKFWWKWRFQEFQEKKSLRESDDDDRNLANIKKLQILV